MKLEQVHVRMFRNILDSTPVAIQGDVTCLVGKNESGKTAFLQALWRLNPARLKPTFSIPDHYPAWLEKRHRMEGKDLDSEEPVEAVFRWENADQQVVAARFGDGCGTWWTAKACQAIRRDLYLEPRLRRKKKHFRISSQNQASRRISASL